MQLVELYENRISLQYINDMRLKSAQNLLKTNEYTVTEVAEAVGFLDYNHFGRLFRKHYGYTPYEVILLIRLAELEGVRTIRILRNQKQFL